MENKEKYALITGGNSGIGFELAKLIAKDGYNLVIVGRNPDTLKQAADSLEQEYKIKVITMSKDLFKMNHAYEVYNEVKNRNIEIDLLVNNAGHGYYNEFVEGDLEMDLNIIHLNICSLVILTKLYLKDMVVREEGMILNTSSIASQSPGPWQSVYHGTKAFVQSFTEAIREEVKDKGVAITALLPGVTDTDFFRKAGMLESKIVQDKSKMADPADVAKDGYEALKAHKDMIVSGFKNKMQVRMNNLTPDHKNAEKMAKQQEPVTKEKQKAG
jgi:short-subunit dehydrogenase